MPIIKCVDCGKERNARYKNTKYCQVCRFIRDLDFIGSTTYKCQSCASPFAPLKRSDKLCPECDVFSQYPPAQRKPCANCGDDKYKQLADEVKLCVKCACTPKLRIGLMQQLYKRQEEAHHEHAGE